MKQFSEVIGKFFSALTAKDYVQVLIIIALAVAYFSRSDKKDAEKAMAIASELCRQDRIKSDSTWQARMDSKELLWQSKFDNLNQEYINTLRGIKQNVESAVDDIKNKDVERVSLNAEVIRKVNRNGKALQDIVNKEPQEK